MAIAGMPSLLAFWLGGGAGVLRPPTIVVRPGAERRPVATLYGAVSAVLDDPQQLRAEEPVLLRMLSQAQEWVALRFRLLIHSFMLGALPGVPWYQLPVLFPTVLVVTEVIDQAGSMLVPVPLTRLRYSDPQWLKTSGTPTRFYRVGWTIVGLYRVPDAPAIYTVTAVCLPVRLTHGAQFLETPVAYDDALIYVAAGLLLIARERKYAKGLALIRQGLALPEPQTEPADAQAVGAAG